MGVEISLYSVGVLDGVKGFGKMVTLAVRQHHVNEHYRIKILNITANIGVKISAILIKIKGNKSFRSTPPDCSRSIKRFFNLE